MNKQQCCWVHAFKFLHKTEYCWTADPKGLFILFCHTSTHNNDTHHCREHTHLFIQSVYKSLYCLCHCHFAVSVPSVQPLPPSFFCNFIFAPPNPSEVTTISTRVNQPQHTSVKHTRPVSCHCVSVPISSRSDFQFGLWLFGAGIVGGVVLV